MPIPPVTRLFVHPIKSFDRISVSQASILPSGALAHDREFALFDQEGNLVNGKRYARVHLIRAAYDLTNFTVMVGARDQEEAQTFHLLDERRQLEAWLSEFFGFAITIKRDTNTGFPDDLESPGPTLLSLATLAEVGSWFPELQGELMSRRFRANIEIAGVPAFWEDRLFGEPHTTVAFTVGDVRCHGVNLCQRCVVPSRHPDSGEAAHGFQKTFSERRRATLPPWVISTRFNHFYRLSVNTRIASTEAGKIIRVGDAIRPGIVDS